MIDPAIPISVLSFLVSILTLYITQLRPPRIGFIVGSTVGLNHQEDGFSLYIPITFTNAANRPGLVNRCSIVFSKPGQSLTSHYIEWTEFRKRDDDTRKYKRDNFAGPIQIDGRSSISKLVWFKWQEGLITYQEGAYQLEFYIWTDNQEKPTLRQVHNFFISAEDGVELAEYKQNNKRTILWMGIDKQIESNKLLTQHEKNILLG